MPKDFETLEKEKQVANGFIFLACEGSSFVSGTALEIDDGYLEK